MRESVLDDLGQEVTGIISPVTICMLLTVACVRFLNPTGETHPEAVYIASAYYVEKDGDSGQQKLVGALINAAIFVVIVGLITFVMFLLFKYGFSRYIFYYLGFSLFTIFFFVTGSMVLAAIETAQLHVDAISFTILLFNFSVVGTLCVFFWEAPLSLKQSYLVVVGVCVAFIFTQVPEWTTWVLLVAMALYDLCAVLSPWGPLKALVELAMEREETIPALVYEGRAVGRRRRPATAAAAAADIAAAAHVNTSPTPRAALGINASAPMLHAHHTHATHGTQAAQHSTAHMPTTHRAELQQPSTAGPIAEARHVEEDDDDRDIELSSHSGASSRHRHVEAAAVHDSNDGAAADDENAPLIAQHDVSSSRGTGEDLRQRSTLRTSLTAADAGAVPRARRHELVIEEADVNDDDDDSGFMGLPSAIKLGLGDFIFYSMLVGRAAMFDLMTVYASFVAIIAGLGMTLLLLALAKQALPALPFSIFMGVSFYFCCRFLLEPFLIPSGLHFVLF